MSEQLAAARPESDVRFFYVALMVSQIVKLTILQL